MKQKERKCRVCGCTELDCRGCIERTGEPCCWVEYNLCSACVSTQPPKAFPGHGDLIARHLKNDF